MQHTSGRRLRAARCIDLRIAATLVAASLALRVGGVTSGSLYRDDAWVALGARTDLLTAAKLGLTVPGFATFHAVWGRMDAASWWAQLPQLAASVATVGATFLLARRMGGERAWALAGAGAVALSAEAIVFATRVKPYSMDSLHAVGVMALALWTVRRPTGRRWLALAGACLAAEIWSASIFPITTSAIAWAVWMCLRHPDPDATATGSARSRAAATATLIAHVFVIGIAAFAVARATPPPLHDSWGSNYISSPERAWRIAAALAGGLFHRGGSLGAVVLGLAAFVVAWRRRDLAPLLLGPIGLAVALAMAGRVPLGGGRIDIYLYPTLALTLAVGLDEVARPLLRRPRTAGPAAVLVTVALVAVTLVSARHVVERAPYPGSEMASLVDQLDGARQPGDGVVVAPYSRFAYARSARPDPIITISRRYSTRFTVASPDPAVLILPAEYYEVGYDPDAGVPFARRHRRVWYVGTDTPATDTAPPMQAYEYEPENRILAAGWRVTRTIRVRGAHADLLVPI